MRKFGLLILFLALSYNCISQWTHCNGPYGGSINWLIQNNSTKSLFAGEYSDRIYRFKKSVGYWEKLQNIPIPDHISDHRLISLQSTDSTIYAGTYYGIFKSQNDGDSWSTVFIDSSYRSRGIVYAKDSILIALGIAGKIYISTNFGLNFTEVSGTLLDTARDFYDVTMMGSRIFLLYDVNINKTISYSDDFGISWHKPSVDIDPTRDAWFNRFRVYGGKIYALGCATIYNSSDFGVTWSKLQTNWFDDGANDIFISNDTVIVATSISGLYISLNSGKNYTAYSNGMPLKINNINQFLPINSKELLAATYLGVFKSLNTGSTWNEFSDKIDIIVNSLTTLNNQLYIGNEFQGVFSTADSGNTWTRKSSGLEQTNLFQRIWDMTSIGNRLILGTANGIFSSDNYGSSWEPRPFYPNNPHHFEYENGKLYAGTSDGIYYSTDSATTWHHLITTSYSCGANALKVKDSLIIVESVCYYHYPPYFTKDILRSDNYGSSFTSVDTYFNLIDIEMLDSLVLGANEDGYMAKSLDFGKTWSLDSTFGQSVIGDIYILESQYIFIGTDSGKIYLSMDKAITWKDITGNFIGNASRFLRFGDNLYVATASSGVWKLDISNLVGIDKVTAQKNLSIFPNPTNDGITLTIPDEFKNNRNLILTIYNNLGQLIKQISLDSTQNIYTISLKDCRAGIYYISLNGDSGHYIANVIRAN